MARVLAPALLLLVCACASASPVADRALDDVAVAPPRGAVDTRPIDARAVAPPPRAPDVTHAACGASVELVRARPLVFEGVLVRTLYDVELRARGPAGLVVALEDRFGGAPRFADVSLTPLVALRLPAGPALDRGAGPSGALFDLGGLALAGLVNLALFPVTVPLGILAGRPEAFLMDAPTFTDGMFDDAVLDTPTWEAEVARRAAPHTKVLATEAERQQRFAAWRSGLALEQQALSCTLDETGACSLRALWPAERARVVLSGLPCAAPPPPEATTTSSSSASSSSSSPPSPPAPPLLLAMPELPPPRPPVALAVPPRPRDDVRGAGAEQTLARWAEARPLGVTDEAARALWPKASRARGAPGRALEDVTLVCQLRARGGAFDVDHSAPELRVRVAWGFDDAVAGQSFAVRSVWRRAIAVERVTLLPGELVKLSVVDVDAFVDDWVGMDVVVFDGNLPLRFEHPRFTATCGAIAPSP